MEFGRPNNEDKKRITNQGIPCPLSLRKEMGNKTLSFLAYEYEAMRESSIYSLLI